ncbi:hypothetical protein [Frigoriglobus tundricola]|uniref:Uncharacterized protein n=1 Tax=Frigoriglobus tundricola TaxID=2774151 RepID=A0A6M5Z5U4_9BACT|nr:hypothetical protein [Frigoriglobus tundricola]QJX01207.1 hypothetical protein FTUN_8846 [Frigoriglobus tundricola]
MGRARYIVCVATIAVAVGGPIVALAAECLLYSSRPFEAERWRAGDARQRMRMAGDLNHSHLLVNRTWAEVVALLGPGDQESPGHLLEYQLEQGGLFGSGPFEWGSRLQVRFDPDTGRVLEVTFFDFD